MCQEERGSKHQNDYMWHEPTNILGKTPLGEQPPPQKKCPKSGKGGLKYGLDSDDTNIWRNIGEMNAKFGTYMTDIWLT